MSGSVSRWSKFDASSPGGDVQLVNGGDSPNSKLIYRVGNDGPNAVTANGNAIGPGDSKDIIITAGAGLKLTGGTAAGTYQFLVVI